MPNLDHNSPRAAIKQWLRSNSSKAHLSENHWSAQTVQNKVQPGPHKHRQPRLSYIHATEEDPCEGTKAARAHYGHAHFSKSKPDTVAKDLTQDVIGLNKSRSKRSSLGLNQPLQNPFSAFQEDTQLFTEQHRPTKRRRKTRRLIPSSQSSTLQPAATVDLRGQGSNVHECPPSSVKVERGVGDQSSATTASICSSASHTSPPPIKTYERRPRRKTREDRYEPKQVRKAKEKSATKKEPGKKDKKWRRKESSGAALLHDFKAPNVSHDRLTLKPSTTLGLFGRGRASSSYRRRPLPDLAFSELEFLNSCKEKTQADTAAERKCADKKSRAADADAEISRYFASRKCTEAHINSLPEHSNQKQARRVHLGHEVPQSFIELPDMPFLGFGNCGPKSASPIKLIKELDTRCVPSRSQRFTRSPTRATSYFSWSQSSPGRYRSAQEGRLEDAASTEAEPRREGSISIPGVDVATASTDPDKGLDERLHIAEAGSLSHYVRSTDHEAAKDRSLELDLKRGESSRVVKAPRVPRTTTSMMSPGDGRDVENRTSHNEPREQHPPLVNRAKDLTANERNQDAPSDDKSGEQGIIKNAVTDSAPASARGPQQSLHMPSLDADLDTLLDQCATYLVSEPAQQTDVQGRNDNARSAEGHIQTQEPSSKNSQEHSVTRSVPSNEGLGHQNRHSTVHRWYPESMVAGHGSKNSRGRSPVKITESGKGSGHVNGSLKYVALCKDAPIPNTTDYQNAWNGYGHLYDHQMEAMSLSLDGMTVYEAAAYNPSPGQDFHHVASPSVTSDRLLHKDSTNLQGEEFDLVTDFIQDDNQDDWPEPHSAPSNALEAHQLFSGSSPGWHPAQEFVSLYPISSIGPGPSSQQLENPQAASTTDEELRGFWRANKLY